MGSFTKLVNVLTVTPTEQERIPYFEGFKKPEKVKNGQRLFEMITALKAVKI